ncbi:MAG: GNAT family N-acetyltransferase, partial [Candidatus Latescibacteria bacterium]|nr:GNAT family N-acetyltransferase [Candidatus Latescibacterota bacterium]
LNLGREREWIEQLYKDQSRVVFGIVLKTSDKLIGSTGFEGIDWRSRRAGFGIAIGDKTQWSKGFGTEATKLVVRYGFDTLNLNRIFLHVFDHNPRAMRAYEKAGFVREGVLRQDRYIEGAYRGFIVMGILREERKG